MKSEKIINSPSGSLIKRMCELVVKLNESRHPGSTDRIEKELLEIESELNIRSRRNAETGE